MNFRAADDDSIRAFFHDAHVHVGVALLARPLAAVALHVSLSDGQCQIFVAAMAIKRFDSPDSVCIAAAAENARQGKQRIRPNFFNQQDKRLRLPAVPASISLERESKSCVLKRQGMR